MQSSSQEK